MEIDNLNLDDLIRAYLRFKDWMDYDESDRSAYCAKEIIVMQQLFGTAYVTAPAELVTASFEDLLRAMEKRRAVLGLLIDAIHGSTEGSEIDDLLSEVDRTSFKSTVHYFTSLHQAIWQTAESAITDVGLGQEELVLDTEPIDDHFDEVTEAAFEDIRAFIVSEHPKIELMSFPAERAYDLGLPRRAPEPINHQFY